MSDINLKELQQVIKTCRANGVTELKIGGVEIKFAPVDSTQQIITTSKVAIPTPEELQQALERSNLERNVDAAQEELALMQIEDPVGFEQRLIEREFEDYETTHTKRAE